MKELVEYARERGVQVNKENQGTHDNTKICDDPQRYIVMIGNIDEYQVVPELDAPAHVGAGWQAVDEKLTVCVNREPWTEWSVDDGGD